MIKKLKLTSIFLVVVLITITISCEKIEYTEIETVSNEERSITSQNLRYEDLPHLNSVDKKIETINSAFNSVIANQRLGDSGQVWILTDEVLYMTYDDTHTYTFTLVREHPEYYIENIVLHYNLNTNLYDEYLVQYDVSEQEYIDIVNNQSLGDSSQVYISQLENGTFSNITDRSSCFRACETICVPCTSRLEHTCEQSSICLESGDDRPYSYQSCGVVCIDTTAPNEEIDAGPSDGGGGGGKVNTNPKPSEVCQNNGETGIETPGGCTEVKGKTVDEKNCEQLQLLGSDASIMQSMNDLQNKASSTSIQREFGYKLTSDAEPEELPLFENNYLHIKPEFGGKIFGISHTHPYDFPGDEKVFPMFSMDDIFNLGIIATKYNSQPNPKDYSLFVFTLTVKSETGTETYALKVNDWLKFTPFLNSYLSNKESYNRDLNIIYDKIYENNGGNISQNYLQALFEFLDKEDFDLDGLDIYRATDETLNNWEKQEYDSSTNTITPKNCND